MFLVIVSVPVLVGLIGGYLTGGRMRQLGGLHLRAFWLPWLAAGIQLAQYRAVGLRHLVQDHLHVPMLLLVFALMCIWMAVNLPGQSPQVRIAGLSLMAGTALNGIAIAFNGRMPYSLTAAATAGLRHGRPYSGPKNMPASGSTRLAALGDIIPVPSLHAVVSIGDLFLVAGITTLVVSGMRIPRHQPVPAAA